MNTSKTIINGGPVGGDYFKLIHSRKSNKYLKDYINLFNLDDYWIFKHTGKQRLVSNEDFLKFKWAGYILFRKDIYDKDKIQEWITFFDKLGGVNFLHKPTPPFNPNKIIIKKDK